jgi:hypothetical protein
MRALLIPLLLLSACSKSTDIYEELPNSSLAGAPREDVPESRMDAPVARPVMIGEDGASFSACETIGTIIAAGDDELPAELRAAPFADSKSAGRLAPGSRVYVCSRTLDQKWLGVVLDGSDVPAAITPATGCGLKRRVEQKQPYSGPCPSGWVSSAYVRLVAG